MAARLVDLVDQRWALVATGGARPVTRRAARGEQRFSFLRGADRHGGGRRGPRCVGGAKPLNRVAVGLVLGPRRCDLGVIGGGERRKDARNSGAIAGSHGAVVFQHQRQQMVRRALAQGGDLPVGIGAVAGHAVDQAEMVAGVAVQRREIAIGLDRHGTKRRASARLPCSLAVMMRLNRRSAASRGVIFERSGSVPDHATGGVSNLGAGEADNDGGAPSRLENVTAANTAKAIRPATAPNPTSQPTDHLPPPDPPFIEAPQS